MRRAAPAPDKLVLELHVQPGAKKSGFAGMHGERRKVRLAAPPVDGKANAELIAFLAEHYGVRKADVEILAGLTSRQKRVSIWKPTKS
ncbi:MAG: DUF167 domain-containing protein [Clostridia bacterium]